MFLSPKLANMRSTKALRDYSALAKRQPTPGTLDDWERIFGWISGEKKTPNGLWPFDGVPWVSQRRRSSMRFGREFQLSIIWHVIIYKANKYGWYEKCGSLEVWVGGREIKEKEERQWSGKVWQRGSGAGWPVIHTGQLWCPCGKGKGPISAPTTLHSPQIPSSEGGSALTGILLHDSHHFENLLKTCLTTPKLAFSSQTCLCLLCLTCCQVFPVPRNIPICTELHPHLCSWWR